MGRILVTGSSGQAGCAIVQSLASEFRVIGLDRKPAATTHYVQALSNKEAILRATEGVEAIIHTASLHAPHISTHSRSEFIETNILGTLNLLEAAEVQGVSKFIYTSTTSLYGRQFEKTDAARWVTEDLQPLPRDIYDITKIAAEQLCEDFFHSEKLQTMSLRVARFWDEPLANKIFYRMYRGVDTRDVVTSHRLAWMHLLIDFTSSTLLLGVYSSREILPISEAMPSRC